MAIHRHVHIHTTHVHILIHNTYPHAHIYTHIHTDTYTQTHTWMHAYTHEHNTFIVHYEYNMLLDDMHSVIMAVYVIIVLKLMDMIQLSVKKLAVKIQNVFLGPLLILSHY